jgi:hypothetical protein
MKEAPDSSETSVLTRATRRNNPEDTILHSHRRENLKSYILTLSTHLRLDPHDLFPSGLPSNNLYAAFSYSICTTWSAHLTLIDLITNYTWRRVQIKSTDIEKRNLFYQFYGHKKNILLFSCKQTLMKGSFQTVRCYIRVRLASFISYESLIDQKAQIFHILIYKIVIIMQ